jgi:hypothetical protein
LKEVSEPIEPSVLKKLKLIPAEPVNIIYVNFKNIIKSKHWKNVFDGDFRFQTQKQKTIFDSLGIDFQKDVDEIIIATQWDDINTFIITLNKSVMGKIKNVDMNDYKSLLIDDRILFITNDTLRIEKIGNDDYKQSFYNHPLFRRIINSIQYKEHFWFVTRNTSVFLKILKNGNSNDEKLEKLFRSINFINFSLRFDKDLSINSHRECIDDYRANLLRGVLNGIISMAALTEPNDPFVEELSKADIYIESKGVDINLKLSKEKVNQIRNSVIANKLKRITEYEQ